MITISPICQKCKILNRTKYKMEFSELAKYRQSDRKYSDKPVEKEKLQKCIEIARLAPSANNSQPWKFVIVDNVELKEQIADCAASLGMNKFTHQTPVMIAVVLEKMNVMSSLGSVIKNKEFSLLDMGIAVNQFCLQAADLGLGTCIIGWFDEKNVRKLLHIGRNKRVPLLIALGYSKSPTRKKIRKPVEKMSSWNRY
jgi:nitroreductase